LLGQVGGDAGAFEAAFELRLQDPACLERRRFFDGQEQCALGRPGAAVALDDGLIVPVLRSVELKSVREIARASRDLAERARTGKLKQSEIEGGTFTVSNLGMFGIPSFSAVLNPPEPGILAVGAVVKRPVVDDDVVQIRPIMAVTLSVDHRATSGAEGARLLASIRRRLEQPLLLVA
jgi:pyruvate dehydrogenase E2 component (dihydrolipoamide acetyltransferase)